MPKGLNFKNFFIALFICILGFLTYNFKDLQYGISQLKGQVKILRNSQDVEAVINSKDFPDSLKQKLICVKDIKAYAKNRLNLNVGENYTTIYDQKGKDILWIVTACPPYELKAYEWSFVIAGSFPYKGYFELDKAFEEEARMKELGYETNVRRVSGWSTLGFFKDPILSNMLFRSEGDLANTIIHELTHATVFIQNEVELNENLATFVGDYGALEYLKNKYSADDNLTVHYLKELREERNFSEYVVAGSKGLDSLYGRISNLDEDEKEFFKTEYIKNWVLGIDSLTYPSYMSFKERSLNALPNNTFFMSYLRYNSFQNSFENEYLNSSSISFEDFVEDLIKGHKKSWYDF